MPELLERTQERLQTLLSSSQSLSLQRYSLADKLANLIDELSSGPKRKDDVDGEGDGEGEHSSVLEQMEALQSELARLEAGLGWATVLEQVIVLR